MGHCEVHQHLTPLQNMQKQILQTGWEGANAGEKTVQTGNRMHMCLRRMAGRIQEMERDGEEGGIWNHSCVQPEDSCFEAERLFVVLCPRQKFAFCHSKDGV